MLWFGVKPFSPPSVDVWRALEPPALSLVIVFYRYRCGVKPESCIVFMLSEKELGLLGPPCPSCGMAYSRMRLALRPPGHWLQAYICPLKGSSWFPDDKYKIARKKDTDFKINYF